MKKASLIGLVLFCMMAGQAVGDAWWWPPTGGAMVAPQNPTWGDIVAITLSGEWPHSCIPNDSAILVMGNDIYFDVILPPDNWCLTVITSWERTESVGPLPPGTYTVYAHLVGDPFVPEMYVPMAEFTVRGPYYVDDDANGANDGSNWENAYNYLQDALTVAIYGDEIRVAEGVYKPDEDTAHPNGTGDRTATFQLRSGVAIKGGYAGFGEPDPNERSLERYETVLSGDLDGNDVDVNDPCDLLTEPSRDDNSYHTVTASGTDANAVIDGFTITAGNANGSYPRNRGGGMCNLIGSPRVANCTFRANSAILFGGAICNSFNGSPLLTKCTFKGNSATNCGGGMYNLESNPTAIDCTFVGNSASLGGGMFNIHTSATVLNSTFIRNTADVMGGGICNRDSNPSLSNCIFRGNSAYRGGGGMDNSQANPIVTNCTFNGNSAQSAYSGGGGIENFQSSPKLTNCTFTANSAQLAYSKGGGICNWSDSTPALTNCIFWGNSASSGPQVYNDGTSSPTVTYSDVQGGWLGEGNIDADPCFVSPGYWADVNDSNIIVEPTDPNAVWVDGDYHLLSGSPCIDAGDNNSLPADVADLDGDGNTAEPMPWDLDGNARIVDGDNDGNSVVDMGAFEAPVPPMEVAMKFTPGALNLGSKGNWVKAHCVLPEGYTVEDVDVNTPATLELLGIEIESDYINVFVNEDDLVEVEIAFGRGAFCSVGTNDEFAEAVVTGSLTSGQRFQGTDTIKIINNKFTCIAVLASYWLEEDCGKPDWCGGADLDEDSIVNFRDFALFDGCCIEVITE